MLPSSSRFFITYSTFIIHNFNPEKYANCFIICIWVKFLMLLLFMVGWSNTFLFLFSCKEPFTHIYSSFFVLALSFTLGTKRLHTQKLIKWGLDYHVCLKPLFPISYWKNFSKLPFKAENVWVTFTRTQILSPVLYKWTCFDFCSKLMQIKSLLPMQK